MFEAPALGDQLKDSGWDKELLSLSNNTPPLDIARIRFQYVYVAFESIIHYSPVLFIAAALWPRHACFFGSFAISSLTIFKCCGAAIPMRTDEPVMSSTETIMSSPIIILCRLRLVRTNMGHFFLFALWIHFGLQYFVR